MERVDNMKKRNNKRSKLNKPPVGFILSCVTIPVIMWLVFYVYANFSSIIMAFHNSQGVVSLANFQRFFKELQLPTSDIFLGFRNTFLTFGILVVAYPFKVLVSFFIYKKVPFAGFYRIVFFLPGIIFSVAVTLIFQRIISVDSSLSQAVANALNLEYVPEWLADSDYANKVVLLHMIWLGFPGDLIIWGGTFARIPVDVLEAGRIDGVTWWTEFTKITVPLVWPTVALQIVLLACGIFGASGQVFLLTGGRYGTMTLTAWMFNNLYQNSGARFTSNAYNYMSAVGLLLTIVAVVISLTIRKVTDKLFSEVEY